MKAAAVLALALLTAVPAWAGAPTDQLKANIDRVIQTLEDPALKAPARGG
ncbi:MAG: hypothetical protein HY294_12585 [Candidatus Rokubacteria bacterium]|nr:hypothetical protein [Candidatus Rokubacteria bacterium]